MYRTVGEILDELDMQVLGRLLNNCRESDRQVGRELGISGGAVRSRVKKMQEAGVIERFALRVEPPMLGRGLFYIVVTGRDPDEILRQARFVGEPYLVAPCVGGVTVCGIVAEDDVQERIELAKNLMRDVRVLSIFEAGGPEIDPGLTRTDLAIMGELVEDPRRKIEDVARAAGLSTKTVARSIEKLHRSDSVYFTLVYDPTKMGAFIPFAVMAWAQDARAALPGLEAVFSDHFLQAPFIAKNHVVLFMYGGDVFQLDDLTQRARDVPGVGSADLFIPKSILFPPGWIRSVIEDAGRSPTLRLSNRIARVPAQPG
ncbi:transcriptional regulator [Cenarchaeum symbiosum A]|uniref:Transcriptional regulator n=1 Tax=Cenarchaeum symbiosum (strain A) TaxID=414004 RepID=A0RXQ9_CENSY|nr:transcriptional regulator [Cenarchaeum symbiosum A]